MNARIKQISIASAILTCLVTSANALPTSGRRISGTILKVEPPGREAEMRRDDKGTVLTFSWNDRTTFIANATFTDAAMLRPGAHVIVTYHKPFFGKPFISRVKSVTSFSARPNK